MKINFLSSRKEIAGYISIWVAESYQSLHLTTEEPFNLKLLEDFVLQNNFDNVHQGISFCVAGKKTE